MMNARALPLSTIADDVRAGLTAARKWLPPRLFYDARGSELFDQITTLPEYYLTAAERAIFERHADGMIALAGDDLSIVELGAGSASKTTLLLRAVVARQGSATYIPVDVSASALNEADARITALLPEISITPHVADYSAGLPFMRSLGGRKLVLYIGSSIGNFEPLEAAALLGRVGRSLNTGDALLLGTDMRKDEATLLAAYDDRQGVTAAFNKNVLARINRELGANFDLDRFTHRAIWNSDESRIEMHLESTEAQRVRIPDAGVVVEFAKGETIHTENSYKFTPQMISALALNSGFALERTWHDPRGYFTVHLLRR